MGPVEDADLALRGNVLGDPPQVVVAGLEGAGDLEVGHRAALRVERRHHVAQGAVLAGCIDPLEDHEDRVLRLRPQPILQAGQADETVGELLVRRSLRVTVGVRRIDRSQADLRAGLHPELVAQAAFGHRWLLKLRRGPSWARQGRSWLRGSYTRPARMAVSPGEEPPA